MFLCTCLTLFRMVAAPFFVFFYLKEFSPFLLLFLASVCELTDFLDGFFSKKWNCISSLGKILDPLSDSFWHLSVLFSFTQGKCPIPLWIPLLTLWRDLIVCLLRLLYALEGIPFQARSNGKLKTACWGISIISFIFGLWLIESDLVSKHLFKKGICLFFSLNCLLSWQVLFHYYLHSLDLLRRFFRNSNL